jgi:DNA-binding NarL/FixJ family response regulator
VPLRAALHDAEAGDLRVLAAEARAELAAAGGRPRRAALTGPASLTPSEARIARLAAEGLTNRAIAERLFVGVKTVEYHLANAYPKLGIRRRRELPTALAEP